MPTSNADVVRKFECEKRGAEQLRVALAGLRTATLTIDASAFTRADAQVRDAIGVLDDCAGVRSDTTFARTIQVTTPLPTPTPLDEALRDLVQFVESYKSARRSDRDTRLALAKLFPSPNPDLRRHAQAMAAWCEGFRLVPRSYEQLPRTPVTRSFVDRAVELDGLQQQQDATCRDKWLALSENQSAQADQLGTREDDLAAAIKKGWIELEDRIDDALRARGSSWEKLGGRP